MPPARNLIQRNQQYGAASNLAWPFWPQNDAPEEKCQMLNANQHCIVVQYTRQYLHKG